MIKWIVSADFRCEDLSEEPRHGMRHYITQEDLQNLQPLQPLQPEETPLTSPDVRHWMLGCWNCWRGLLSEMFGKAWPSLAHLSQSNLPNLLNLQQSRQFDKILLVARLVPVRLSSCEALWSCVELSTRRQRMDMYQCTLFKTSMRFWRSSSRGVACSLAIHAIHALPSCLAIRAYGSVVEHSVFRIVSLLDLDNFGQY